MTALADKLRGKPKAEILAALSGFSDEEVASLVYDWHFWARENQLPPPGDWLAWLLTCGRGWGKTLVGSQTVRMWKEHTPRICLLAPTASAVRDVLIEGESGLLATAPPWDRPVYEPSKRLVRWENGAQALCFSGDEPDRIRGNQFGFAWIDELAAFYDPQDALDQVLLSLRLGKSPRLVITTTPRPLAVLRNLVRAKNTFVTRGVTHENLPNLAPNFRDAILSKYAGTSLEAQEIFGELLDAAVGALFSRSIINETRVQSAPPLRRVIMAVDPSVSSNGDGDECGIVVCGLGEADGRGYLLHDASLRASPEGWARRSAQVARQWNVSAVYCESNQGGSMCETVLRAADRSLPIRLLHASKSKTARAEPIAQFFEQRKISFVGNDFRILEDQMCSFVVGDRSPDRLDAAVHALTQLGITGSGSAVHYEGYRSIPRGRFSRGSGMFGGDVQRSDWRFPPK